MTANNAIYQINQNRALRRFWRRFDLERRRIILEKAKEAKTNKELETIIYGKRK